MRIERFAWDLNIVRSPWRNNKTKRNKCKFQMKKLFNSCMLTLFVFSNFFSFHFFDLPGVTDPIFLFTFSHLSQIPTPFPFHAFFSLSLQNSLSQNDQLNDQNSNGTPKFDAVEATMVSPWLVSADVVTTSSKPKAPVRKTVITTQL